MNRTILLCAACVTLIATGSCSNEAPATGGASGGTSGTGGAQGSGGSNGSGGSTGDGGAMSGSGGSTGDGGAMSGSGGDTSGSGGASTDDSGAGSGGDTSGSGGGGTGGSGGGGTGGGTGITPADIVPMLDGFYWEGTCSGGSTEAGRDCSLKDDNNTCPTTSTSTPFDMRGAFRKKVLNVLGTPGTKYKIDFEVRGVAGGKRYTGGTAASTTYTEGPEGNNGWYVGGTPTDSKWNTYELHVDPPVTGEANVYYLNGMSTYDGRHETFVIKFTASFVVLGGGTMTFVLHDSNCLGQQNCGQNLDATCTAPRTVDVSGMTPPPPSTFHQPPVNTINTSQFHPQWLFFDVKSVTQL